MDKVLLKEFCTIQVTLDLRNLTTGIGFRKSPEPRLTEFSGDSLVVESSERACAANHHLLITARANIVASGEIRTFSATAKVEEVQPSGEGIDRVSVKLLQFEQREYEEFFGLFETRQGEITEFLVAAKGYGVVPA